MAKTHICSAGAQQPDRVLIIFQTHLDCKTQQLVQQITSKFLVSPLQKFSLVTLPDRREVDDRNIYGHVISILKSKKFIYVFISSRNMFLSTFHFNIIIIIIIAKKKWKFFKFLYIVNIKTINLILFKIKYIFKNLTKTRIPHSMSLLELQLYFCTYFG